MGHKLYDRSITIEYSKTQSHSTKRRNGELDVGPMGREPLASKPRRGEDGGPRLRGGSGGDGSESTSRRQHDDGAALEVSGFPGDASCREVSHLFRPFPGFRGLRVHPNATAACAMFKTPAQAEVCARALEGYVFDRLAHSSPRLHLRPERREW